jgi:hypothetical protein
MKVIIEIPVNVDGKLSEAQSRAFRKFLRDAINPLAVEFAKDNCGEGLRMFKTVCRYGFSKPNIKVKK